RTHQLPRKLGQAVDLVRRPTRLHREVLSLDITELTQRLREARRHGVGTRSIGGGGRPQHTDAVDALLRNGGPGGKEGRRSEEEEAAAIEGFHPTEYIRRSSSLTSA